MAASCLGYRKGGPWQTRSCAPSRTASRPGRLRISRLFATTRLTVASVAMMIECGVVFGSNTVEEGRADRARERELELQRDRTDRHRVVDHAEAVRGERL